MAEKGLKYQVKTDWPLILTTIGVFLLEFEILKTIDFDIALMVARDETDEFNKILWNTTKFSRFNSQIHSAVKGMIKVSIEVEKFVLKLANIF